MKTSRNYYALDDIGFLGIPNKKHSEKYFAEIGMTIAIMRKKQRSSKGKPYTYSQHQRLSHFP
jgi:hypothetical protein